MSFKNKIVVGLTSVLIVAAFLPTTSTSLASTKTSAPAAPHAVMDTSAYVVTDAAVKAGSTVPAQKTVPKKPAVKKKVAAVPIVHSKYERRIKPSAYRGKWYDARFEKNRRCIEWRESNGHYNAHSRSSTAAGAYQFLRSTSNHMAKLISMPWLAKVPASKWSRYAQDKAFWRLWSHGKGRAAWAGGNWNCF